MSKTHTHTHTMNTKKTSTTLLKNYNWHDNGHKQKCSAECRLKSNTLLRSRYVWTVREIERGKKYKPSTRSSSSVSSMISMRLTMFGWSTERWIASSTRTLSKAFFILIFDWFFILTNSKKKRERGTHTQRDRERRLIYCTDFGFMHMIPSSSTTRTNSRFLWSWLLDRIFNAFFFRKRKKINNNNNNNNNNTGDIWAGGTWEKSQYIHYKPAVVHREVLCCLRDLL